MEQLLSTKLFIPTTRPELVSRQRLVRQLNQGLHQNQGFRRRLSLISAPAGFGKTTLLSEWLNSINPVGANESPRQCSIAWLSLDESDNDPTRFLAYVIAALRTVEPDIAGGALSALQSTPPPSAATMLIAMINEIAALPDRMMLVLDDYHLVENKSVHNALNFLLEHQPVNLHLVISTRVDPPLPLSRYRVRDQMTELRAADLRFSASETADFLNHAMGLNLPAGEITALATRTEGWAAGLQLAAISLQGHNDTAGRIEAFTGSHRLVLDYLVEEVLGQLSQEVQDFLLQTAILDRLTGSLCDAVRFADMQVPAGQDSGQAILEMLDHANLFIIPLDQQRGWYRYHHLFADLLHQRLLKTQASLQPILHRRASAWYEQNNFIDEAIEHALRCEGFERTAELIEKNIEHIFHFGERSRLSRWLNAIPDEVASMKPHLCILHAGNSYIGGHIHEAERCLLAAEQALGLGASTPIDGESVKTGTAPDQRTLQLRGRAAAVRSLLLSYNGDVAGAIQYANLAIENLPESDSTWRYSAFDSLATAYGAQGDTGSALKARRDALEASRASGNAYMVLLASLRLVVTLREMGRLQQALDICQQQLQIAADSGLSQTALTGWLYTLWAEILAERNELDRALEMARKGVALTEREKDVALLGSSYLSLMRVLFSCEKMADAQEIIRKVNDYSMMEGFSQWITNQMAAWQARIWLAEGNLTAASLWAENSAIDLTGELTPTHDFDYVVLARILGAQGRLDDASRLLEQLIEGAKAGGRISKMIELLILQALTAHARGDTDQAVLILEQAFTLAEPGGFVRVFADEGQPMAALLYEALSRKIAPDYTRRLLAVFTAAETGKPEQVPQSGLVEPLSERETEVLLLIAKGLTNPEIGSRLYLSLNTVKAHTRNIYGKLGVNNRTQAVQRARALGILPAD